MQIWKSALYSTWRLLPRWVEPIVFIEEKEIVVDRQIMAVLNIWCTQGVRVLLLPYLRLRYLLIEGKMSQSQL